jgi:hypothetical protein
MKKLLLSIVSAFLLFALNAQVTEDFSDYTVGGKLAQQAQAMGRDYWTTWSNAPGGAEDGVVAEQPAGNKCLKLIAPNNDQVLRLGDKNGSAWEPKTSGAWELTFKIFIPTGKDGYFNIKSVFPSDVSETWAMQIYMGTDEGSPGPATPGVGKIYGGSSNGVNFNFTHNTWVPIKIFIDLDDDVAEFYVNDNLVHTYQYSLGSFGNSNHRYIAAMNIFPPNTAATSEFYIDDIAFVNAAGSQVLFETNFDELSAGAYVAQSYPDWWTTWENNPGTSEDALITTEQFQTSPNSAKCAWGTDLLFLAGDKTSGVYTIDFDMYIPTSQRAFFNLLHFFDSGNGGQDSEWAVGVYFNVTTAGGPQAGTYIHQNGLFTNFTPVYATWFPVSITVDLDNDVANMKINGEDLLTWQFSLTENGGVGERKLGRLDLFPPQAGAIFYFDNFVYASLSEVHTFPIIDVTPTAITKMLVPGEIVTEAITVSNTGTSMGNYSSWIEFDFEPDQGTQTYPIQHCANQLGVDGGLGYGGTDDILLELGTKFSGEQLCGKIGTYVTKMSYYLPVPAGNANKLIFRIYGPGNGNTPGELLMEVVKTNASVAAWTEVTLPDPLLIDKDELWFSVEFLHLAGTYPIGVDDGPLVLGCNFTKRNGNAWSLFTQEDFGNFLVRATAQGTPIPCWLSINGDTYGNVPKGSEKTFNAKFNTTGLAVGQYKANIFVNTNDEEHLQFIIPCTLMVGNGPYMDVNTDPIVEAIELKIGDPTSITKTITVENKGNENGTFDANVEGTGSWLTLSGSVSGVVVPAGEQRPFDAVFEAADLAEGTYDAKIVITTSDTYHSKFEIPCTLTVTVNNGIEGYTIQTLVYPNPANDQVTVKSNTVINSLQVFSNMGQMVFSTNVNSEETTINTSTFNAGVYFIKVNTTEGSQNVKLIVK